MYWFNHEFSRPVKIKGMRRSIRRSFANFVYSKEIHSPKQACLRKKILYGSDNLTFTIGVDRMPISLSETAATFTLKDKDKKMTEVKNEEGNDLLIELTSEIVAAYVSNNAVVAGDLPSLISNVHAALGGVANSAKVEEVEKPKPAVPVRRSVQNDFIICLEDGQKFKSLKRHLMTHYNLTPEQYREKWELPADYPMVAPAYAEARSRLAKEMGLGQKRKRKAKAA